MFKNVGQQVKTLAKIIFGVGLVITWITGIYELFTVDGWMIPVSLIVSVACSGLVYILSLLVYAFGELVDCTSYLKNTAKDMDMIA